MKTKLALIHHAADEIKDGSALFVSSPGGHWSQLNILFESCQDLPIVKICAGKRGNPNGHYLSDCNLNTPLRALIAVFQSYKILRKSNPNTVISTGALPGLIMLIVGWVFGAKTIWIESVANRERLSLSGRVARKFVAHCFTQSERVSQKTGLPYMGSLL